jgi:hypothetical protein
VVRSPDDLRTKLVAAARGYLGVAEATGRNDGVPSELFVFGEKKAWCAGFCARVYADAGAPLPGKTYLLPSVSYMEDRMIEAARWVSAADVRANGAHLIGPGDLVFFLTRANSDNGPGRHVEIVEEVKGGVIHTIGGNVSNKVARQRWKLDEPTITGFGRAC